MYACLVEPLILAAQGRMEPFAQGRRISPDGLEQFGQAAKALGFEPRLARGWRGVEARRLRG